MKRIELLLFMCLWTALVCQAQDNGISINARIVDERIPEEAARNLENKLQRIIVANGFGDLGYTARFVLTAKVDITQKDIVNSTPARISEKMDITLMVGDVVENIPYATCVISVSGIGINENKAYISAFNALKPQDQRIVQMLDEARTKITDYYTNRCGEIVTRANTLAATGKYDEAIFRLVSVPNVCTECFEQCQSQAAAIYQQRIDEQGVELLEKARNAWAAQQDGNGATKAAQIISGISPKAANYQQVVTLRNTIASKLQTDAKRQWDFKMKQYEDSQAFKRSIVEGVRDIGVAWASHQPTSVVKVIRSWW